MFAIHTDSVREDANPADAGRWQFHVVATSLLDERFPTQKSIGMTTLHELAGPVPFHSLRYAIVTAVPRARADR